VAVLDLDLELRQPVALQEQQPEDHVAVDAEVLVDEVSIFVGLTNQLINF
jgi:hypothetical protein